MELKEAFDIIDATLGMFSSFADEIENSLLGEKFLAIPVYICEKKDEDTNKSSFKKKTMAYYKYEEGGKINKRYIVDIRPVCSCMVNEWPSNKTKRIRKILNEVFFQCLDYCKDNLDENMINYALDEGYDYHRRYNESEQETCYIEDVILDSIHEMHHSLGLTEDDETEIEEKNENIGREKEDSIVLPDDDNCIKRAIMQLKKDRVIKNKYDYAFIMMVMNDSEKLPSFNSSNSFLNYLRELKIDDLPSVDSIKKMNSTTLEHYPSWTFTDKKGRDASEAKRRIEVAERFISLCTKEN